MLFTSVLSPKLRIVGKPKPAHRQAARTNHHECDREVRRRSPDDNRRCSEQWLATLSHELRSPLATILDALDLAFSQLDQPRAKRAGEIAQRQARKAMQLIDDLFDLSAHSCGKLALCKETVQVSDIVTRATETASHLITGRRHSLTVSLPPRPVFLVADRLRLEQVMTNLLINAAKFTEPGGHIRLTVTEELGEIVVRVEDNGRGIAAELLPRVFDLHQQASDLGDRRPTGLGLGLTLVKTLVELHGGRVSAKSNGAGTGSEFIVCLPTRARSA